MKRRILAGLGAAFLMLTMAGCNVFRSKFPDYDVSGYLKALLDSSYLGENEDLIALTNQTEMKAQENGELTVENGVVYFSNAFSINPTGAQMQEVRELVRTAYGMSRYQVLEKQETATGYNVDIEVEPLTVFAKVLPEAEQLRANTDLLREKAGVDSNANSDGEEDLDEEADGEEDESDETTEDSSDGPVVLNEVFVEEVLNMCRREMSNPSYGQKKVISMKILRTEAGELQIDTTQLEEIDESVVLFQALTP